MVQRSGSSRREIGRQEKLLDTSGMGCGKTQNQRETRKDWMEELERKVAGKSAQEEFSKSLRKRARGSHVHINQPSHCLVLRILPPAFSIFSAVDMEQDFTCTIKR